MVLNSVEISDLIKERISKFDIETDFVNEGTIISVSDGIIRIYGLTSVMQNEMILLPTGCFALALNLERDSVGAVVLGTYLDVHAGMRVQCTGKILEVPVGHSLLGRIVNALGFPVDGLGSINYDRFYCVENSAPSVIDRKSITQALHTGYKMIDAMIPIGKGQRELIIGDRQTGKSSLAIDIIINQRDTGVKCIYVAIGQKISTVIGVVKKLQENRALKNTIVVVAAASEASSLQYLSPYSGCAMGEYFRDHGEDALIVYDDLSKHAISYRQISLLLRRPPGREAYPGDVFYLHSRLLERSARVNVEYVEHFTKGKIKNKTGSLTAIPIIETQSGDISSFIPTNVISITDGQIFLESSLFHAGVYPAINPGISVSRVGSAAQTSIIKKLSGGIRSILAQYRELESFSQFSSDLDNVTKEKLQHGKRVTELFKQKQYSPMSISRQSLLLFALEYGYLHDLDISSIWRFEDQLIEYAIYKHKDFMQEIDKYGLYNSSIKSKLRLICSTFKEKFFIGV
ncbi:MAG: ATP synthase F1 complex subunit alpha [Candidatus Westeberhardia cardiocondylae]|nr:ATP synthase F1 complex subunit alpha [Candidatus Westeberhardia cardiocondylae]